MKKFALILAAVLAVCALGGCALFESLDAVKEEAAATRAELDEVRKDIEKREKELDDAKAERARLIAERDAALARGETERAAELHADILERDKDIESREDLVNTLKATAADGEVVFDKVVARLEAAKNSKESIWKFLGIAIGGAGGLGGIIQTVRQTLTRRKSDSLEDWMKTTAKNAVSALSPEELKKFKDAQSATMRPEAKAVFKKITGS